MIPGRRDDGCGDGPRAAVAARRRRARSGRPALPGRPGMTSADRLLELIDAADEPGIVALLAPLDEPARRKLEPAVAERVRRHKADADLGGVPLPDDHLVRQARTGAAFLAWLGVAELAELPPLERHDPEHWRWYLHRAAA